MSITSEFGLTCYLKESADSTPPEVEPDLWKVEADCSCEFFTEKEAVERSRSLGFKITEYFSKPAPPSPKAEYSADGEPLNLRAAARDVAGLFTHSTCDEIDNLRKFLDEDK